MNPPGGAGGGAQMMQAQPPGQPNMALKQLMCQQQQQPPDGMVPGINQMGGAGSGGGVMQLQPGVMQFNANMYQVGPPQQHSMSLAMQQQQQQQHQGGEMAALYKSQGVMGYMNAGDGAGNMMGTVIQQQPMVQMPCEGMGGAQGIMLSPVQNQQFPGQGFHVAMYQQQQPSSYLVNTTVMANQNDLHAYPGQVPQMRPNMQVVTGQRLNTNSQTHWHGGGFGPRGDMAKAMYISGQNQQQQLTSVPYNTNWNNMNQSNMQQQASGVNVMVTPGFVQQQPAPAFLSPGGAIVKSTPTHCDTSAVVGRGGMQGHHHNHAPPPLQSSAVTLSVTSPSIVTQIASTQSVSMTTTYVTMVNQRPHMTTSPAQGSLRSHPPHVVASSSSSHFPASTCYNATHSQALPSMSSFANMLGGSQASAAMTTTTTSNSGLPSMQSLVSKAPHDGAVINVSATPCSSQHSAQVKVEVAGSSIPLQHHGPNPPRLSSRAGIVSPMAYSQPVMSNHMGSMCTSQTTGTRPGYSPSPHVVHTSRYNQVLDSGDKTTKQMTSSEKLDATLSAVAAGITASTVTTSTYNPKVLTSVATSLHDMASDCSATPMSHGQNMAGGALTVTVPFGWKRTLEVGSIVYYSPSDCRLSSVHDVQQYLASDGTCKCGLGCPLLVDKVFVFDPHVASRQWCKDSEDPQDSLTKLCNHKRKIIAMANFQNTAGLAPGHIPGDNTMKLTHLPAEPLSPGMRDAGGKRRKKSRGNASPFDGMHVSDILTHRDKMQDMGEYPHSHTPGSQALEHLKGNPQDALMYRHTPDFSPSPGTQIGMEQSTLEQNLSRDPMDDLGPITCQSLPKLQSFDPSRQRFGPHTMGQPPPQHLGQQHPHPYQPMHPRMSPSMHSPGMEQAGPMGWQQQSNNPNMSPYPMSMNPHHPHHHQPHQQGPPPPGFMGGNHPGGGYGPPGQHLPPQHYQQQPNMMMPMQNPMMSPNPQQQQMLHSSVPNHMARSVSPNWSMPSPYGMSSNSLNHETKKARKRVRPKKDKKKFNNTYSRLDDVTFDGVDINIPPTSSGKGEKISPSGRKVKRDFGDKPPKKPGISVNLEWVIECVARNKSCSPSPPEGFQDILGEDSNNTSEVSQDLKLEEVDLDESHGSKDEPGTEENSIDESHGSLESALMDVVVKEEPEDPPEEKCVSVCAQSDHVPVSASPAATGSDEVRDKVELNSNVSEVESTMLKREEAPNELTLKEGRASEVSESTHAVPEAIETMANSYTKSPNSLTQNDSQSCDKKLGSGVWSSPSCVVSASDECSSTSYLSSHPQRGGSPACSNSSFPASTLLSAAARAKSECGTPVLPVIPMAPRFPRAPPPLHRHPGPMHHDPSTVGQRHQMVVNTMEVPPRFPGTLSRHPPPRGMSPRPPQVHHNASPEQSAFGTVCKEQTPIQMVENMISGLQATQSALAAVASANRFDSASKRRKSSSSDGSCSGRNSARPASGGKKIRSSPSTPGIPTEELTQPLHHIDMPLVAPPIHDVPAILSEKDYTKECGADMTSQDSSPEDEGGMECEHANPLGSEGDSGVSLSSESPVSSTCTPVSTSSGCTTTAVSDATTTMATVSIKDGSALSSLPVVSTSTNRKSPIAAVISSTTRASSPHSSTTQSQPISEASDSITNCSMSPSATPCLTTTSAAVLPAPRSVQSAAATPVSMHAVASGKEGITLPNSHYSSASSHSPGASSGGPTGSEDGIKINPPPPKKRDRSKKSSAPTIASLLQSSQPMAKVHPRTLPTSGGMMVGGHHGNNMPPPGGGASANQMVCYPLQSFNMQMVQPNMGPQPGQEPGSMNMQLGQLPGYEQYVNMPGGGMMMPGQVAYNPMEQGQIMGQNWNQIQYPMPQMMPGYGERPMGVPPGQYPHAMMQSQGHGTFQHMNAKGMLPMQGMHYMVQAGQQGQYTSPHSGQSMVPSEMQHYDTAAVTNNNVVYRVPGQTKAGPSSAHTSPRPMLPPNALPPNSVSLTDSSPGGSTIPNPANLTEAVCALVKGQELNVFGEYLDNNEEQSCHLVGQTEQACVYQAMPPPQEDASMMTGDDHHPMALQYSQSVGPPAEASYVSGESSTVVPPHQTRVEDTSEAACQTSFSTNSSIRSLSPSDIPEEDEYLGDVPLEDIHPEESLVEEEEAAMELPEETQSEEQGSSKEAEAIKGAENGTYLETTSQENPSDSDMQPCDLSTSSSTMVTTQPKETTEHIKQSGPLKPNFSPPLLPPRENHVEHPTNGMDSPEEDEELVQENGSPVNYSYSAVDGIGHSDVRTCDGMQDSFPDDQLEQEDAEEDDDLDDGANHDMDGESDLSDEEIPNPIYPRTFKIGDLVWGPIRGFPSWPGKLVHESEVKGSLKADEGNLWVCWFGDHSVTQVETGTLKTLSEGLEAHHKARQKHRKGRKMNTTLESAIQEAMDELDRQGRDDEGSKLNNSNKQGKKNKR